MEKEKNAKVLRLKDNTKNNDKKKQKKECSTSKSKKQLTRKSFKSPVLKTHYQGKSEETQIEPEVLNDYGVNSYYEKYNKSKYFLPEPEHQNKFQQFQEEEDTSDYKIKKYQKLKFPENRGVINADGKFVTVSNKNQNKSQHNTFVRNYSFQNSSSSKHTISMTNAISKDKRKKNTHQKNTRHLKKSLSTDQIIKSKSADKAQAKKKNANLIRQYEPVNQKKQPRREAETIKIIHNYSKTSSLASETQISNHRSILDQRNQEELLEEVKIEIQKESESINKTIKKIKINQSFLKERAQCINIINQICDIMCMRRESNSLAIYYLDQLLLNSPVENLKKVTLSSLTLALKMDDAEMVNRFYLEFLQNPERTVKKSISTNFGKNYKKKENCTNSSLKEKDELRLKLANILLINISENVKNVREEVSLEEVMDFETEIMLKLNFKLSTKTITYWIDLLTTLWDGFIYEKQPSANFLLFRHGSDLQLTNFSFLTQLLEFEFYFPQVYCYSKVSLVFSAMYLLIRIRMHQHKEQTSLQKLFQYYQINLSKSSNILFCDETGTNMVFGEFLLAFEMNMANIIQCSQHIGKHLEVRCKEMNFGKREGKNLNDRLSMYHNHKGLFEHFLSTLT